MSYPTAKEIRQQFIDYFVKKCGHTFVPSSPCVPLDDPTLMFANAGMNQFKPIFLGQQAPDVDRWPGVTPGMATRAANTQKCIRAGGKHNDLDDVGHDTYHHTFFEMLGNWSFGDYFKKEAIEWAWDLLTNVWKIDASRLHATYFQGDPAEGLEPDNEARDLWRKILPAERVHPGNKKDNFWEMGDTGPCGPCSEIHIDLTPDKSGGPLVNKGDARVMEIWNLVFIQFNRGGDGKLTPLPAKHVDTGMGFERVTSVLQGKKSNYDTDVFTPIFLAIQKVTGADTYTGLLEDSGSHTSSPKAQLMKDIAYRVIADHIRTLTFALTDGAVPSNEGRGYVLRRILRRAVRYGRQYLGTREPFLCRLVPAVGEAMGEAFPELRKAHGGKNVEHVAAILKDEEESFGKTLDRGIALFEQAAEQAVKNHHGRVSGEDAFKLHDTYGFPVDLTELMAEERGLTVNIGEYERLMEEAREKSRVKKFAQHLNIPEEYVTSSTRDIQKYDPPASGLRAKYLFADAYGENRSAFLFDQTPFYSEQGGQVGDSGEVVFGTTRMQIDFAFRDRDKVLHVIHIKELDKLPEDEELHHGQEAVLFVDLPNRAMIMANHTSTHVMNWALREVLGEHVQQKGSLVDPEKTRFDFSHPSALSEQELSRIEELVNQQIERKLPVHAKEVPQKEALKINGLRAVFGEKYPEVVRVVSIGPSVDELLVDPANAKWRGYSIEFCGGTHLKSTKEAERFRLVEESAVAKGIRRVVAVTGEKAKAAGDASAAVLRLINAAMHADEAVLQQRIAEITALMAERELPIVDKMRMRADLVQLQDKAKQAAKQAAKAGAADATAQADAFLDTAVKIGNTSIVCGHMAGANVDQLRAAADSLRARASSAAVLLAGDADGKVTLLAAMTPDVIERGVKAGDLIREIAPIVGGKGGGRPDMAQGGGTDASKIGDAVTGSTQWLKSKLGG